MSRRARAHAIPDHVNNSTLEYLVAERIRYTRDRDMLTDWWFNDLSLYALAQKYNCSQTHVKDVVYGFGDPLLVEAADMDKN